MRKQPINKHKGQNPKQWFSSLADVYGLGKVLAPHGPIGPRKGQSGLALSEVWEH